MTGKNCDEEFERQAKTDLDIIKAVKVHRQEGHPGAAAESESASKEVVAYKFQRVSKINGPGGLCLKHWKAWYLC